MFSTNNDREESCIREGGTYSGNVCATPSGPAQPDSKPDRIFVMFPSLPVDGRSLEIPLSLQDLNLTKIIKESYATVEIRSLTAKIRSNGSFSLAFA